MAGVEEEESISRPSVCSLTAHCLIWLLAELDGEGWPSSLFCDITSRKFEKIYYWLCIRPAENIFGQNAQTPQLTLGQSVSAYQVLTLWRPCLPRR